jgi:hypothetical protein
MTDQTQPSNGNGLSGGDMLALVAHITGLLSEMEGRIMGRLDSNAAGASERWSDHEKKHAKEQAENTKQVCDRFIKIETALDAHIRQANEYFAKQHDEEVALQARVRPVKTLAGWLAVNWKSVLLAVLAIAGIFGWLGLETHIAGQ